MAMNTRLETPIGTSEDVHAENVNVNATDGTIKSSRTLDTDEDADLGALELYDEYGDWKRFYADSVSMPLHEKIR